MARGEPEHGLERDVSVEAPIISEDKLVEVGVDVLAAQRAPSASSARRPGESMAGLTLRPASLKQKRRAARLVWKTRLEFAQRSCPCHWAPPRARRMWPPARLLYIIWSSLGQRDKPLVDDERQ